MVTESRNTRTKLRNKKFSIHVSLSKSMQVVFLSKMLYIIVRGQLWQEVALAHFYSIYNLWSQYQAVNLHKAVTLPFPVGDCLIQSQLYCPLSIAVHCLENKRKFLYQWNLLFYNSFLYVILPSMWIPQPESERVKNLPLIWLSSILLGMQRNTKMFRINFEKHAKVRLWSWKKHKSRIQPFTGHLLCKSKGWKGKEEAMNRDFSLESQEANAST